MEHSRRRQSERWVRWMLALVVASAVFAPVRVTAQDDPFGDTEFVSPKFGTVIEWDEAWSVDPDNSAIQVRRDVLGLIRDGGNEAILIELQSQRSYRTGAEFISAALQNYARLPAFTIIEDAVNEEPASTTFTFELTDPVAEVAGYIQAHPIAGAMMVAIVLALPDQLEQTKALANGDITVNGVPLLEALPICGEASNSDAQPEGSSSSGTSKTGSKPGGATAQSSPATCVELVQSSASDQPRPTPTPEPQQSRGDSFNQRSWSSDSFPNVSVSYDRRAWSVEEELVAAENSGRDGVLLFHAELPAYVIVEVFNGFNGRAGACIDVALAEAGIAPGSDELLTDQDGNPIQGSQQGRVWSAYAYQVQTDDGSTEVGGYVECRSLPGASGVLIFTMVCNISQFEACYDEIQPMLRSIRTR